MAIAAVYLRCSTAEQTIESQRADVEQLARARGFDIRGRGDAPAAHRHVRLGRGDGAAHAHRADEGPPRTRT
jgi:DNA invertase Pin-like site-specific DNA recombinase